MKLHIVGTVNRLNVEHRTSNIERPILRRYALSILRQANRNISNVEGRNRFAQSFLNRQNTLFDVGRWTFDVRRSSVSFSIKLAVFWARGGARMKLHQNGAVS